MSDQDQADADVHVELQEAGPLPSGTAGPLVVVMQEPLRDLTAHAAEETEHEIAGILLGSVVDGSPPVVLVEASIRGTKLAYSRTNVTFTHETWSEINAVKDSQYPDLKMVGWYHSHPGFGLFLSEYDLFIHRNFFSAPWQVALVTDPLAKTWGVFTWQAGEVAREPEAYTASVERTPDPEPPAHAAAASAPDQRSPIIIRADPAPSPRDKGLSAALGVMGLLLALAIGIALATYHDLELLKRQMTTLNQQVVSMSHELTVVRDRVLDLSQPASPTAGPSGPSTTPGVAPPAGATVPAPSPTPSRPAPGASPP